MEVDYGYPEGIDLLGALHINTHEDTHDELEKEDEKEDDEVERAVTPVNQKN